MFGTVRLPTKLCPIFTLVGAQYKYWTMYWITNMFSSGIFAGFFFIQNMNYLTIY